MTQSLAAPPYPAAPPTNFTDRRNYDQAIDRPLRERRQFTNTHDELSSEAQELAGAIDAYKLRHRRRFITCEEMLLVMKSLGYSK
jgi:hypothetical protein